MVRGVFDTVVFVRALINPRSVCGRLAFELYPRYHLITSPAILKEVLEVLHRPEIRSKSPHFNSVPFDRVLAVLSRAEVVEPGVKLTVCRDPGDDKFLEAAVAGKAQYVITEDLDLLALDQYAGMQVMDTCSFLQVVRILDP